MSYAYPIIKNRATNKYMKTATFHHLEQELLAWQRSLEFFKQENTMLKYRLSEMVDETDDESLLESAEVFQSEFLKNDEMLERISKSLHAFSVSFINKQSTIQKAEIIREQNRLRENIHEFEKSFFVTATEFNSKMLPLV